MEQKTWKNAISIYGTSLIRLYDDTNTIIWEKETEIPEYYGKSEDYNFGLDPLTILPLEDGHIIITGSAYAACTINYSTDPTFATYNSLSFAAKTSTSKEITVKKLQPIYLYSENYSAHYNTSSYLIDYWLKIDGDIDYYARGNITSMKSKTLNNNAALLGRLFYNVSHLVGAKYVSWGTSIPSGVACYHSLFRFSANLKTIPMNIPRSTSSTSPYGYMFENCKSLEDVSYSIIADGQTNTGSNYFFAMFNGCTALKKGPKLMSIYNTKGSNCMSKMYQGCTNLQWIFYMGTTSPTASNGSLDLTSGVTSPTGIFVKNSTATWNVTGVNGVPSGWTIIYYNTSTKKYYLSNKTTECDEEGNPI